MADFVEPDDVSEIFTNGSLVPPSNLSAIKKGVIEFIAKNDQRPVVLVTVSNRIDSVVDTSTENDVTFSPVEQPYLWNTILFGLWTTSLPVIVVQHQPSECGLQFLNQFDFQPFIPRYFLEKGYAVIYLYRQKSLEPFTRNFSLVNLFDCLSISSENQDQQIRDQQIVLQSELQSNRYKCELRCNLSIMRGERPFDDHGEEVPRNQEASS